ncbi:MAG: hypothetical protein EHM21_14975 [Chloroflexi bacterium]|nr:MAG: hypothetical protein EHM21_14975 [Chloroflexota bacterium]
MANAGTKVDVRLDLGKTYQTIDGFGVNINSKYWTGERLLPALDLLVNDLGARLFRVDIWGKSNWIDPTGELGPAALAPERLEAIYQGEIFQRGWAMMRYLNEQGIEPYLTASGDVPGWMLGPDGKTLQNYGAFCNMLVSLVEWARRKEGIRFSLFGPLNETDIGSPEGPTVSPEDYRRVCEILAEKLAKKELDDIRLVVAEQANFTPDYLDALVKSTKLRERIAVFSMHDYLGFTEEQYRCIIDAVRLSPYADKPMWFGEFGDLEQSGEKEWYVAWAMVSRLLDHLAHGFSGSLAWDAFDNYHDHDEAWTIYGLLRTGLRVYTPKKRYYALKHVYRCVLPGFVRIGANADSGEVRVLAFANPERTALTVVGMNLSSSRTYYLNIDSADIQGALRAGKAAVYRTSEHENFVLVDRVPLRGPNYPFMGMEVCLPPDSIFTVTTI